MAHRSIGTTTLVLAAVAVLVGAYRAQAVDIRTVPVGNPGNPMDTRYPYGGVPGLGGVAYTYNIGMFEVTAGQYMEFLNAAAATDTYGLYDPRMNSSPFGCQITQNGTSGNFSYDFSGRPSGTEADWANRPVNLVSWGNAARFANWLHNSQPTGAQGLGTTEDGAYLLDGATSDSALLAIVRESDATWVIPSEDEWYKAAYHKNDGVTDNYFDYPTSGDGVPGYIGDGESIPDSDPGNYATYDGDGGIDGIGPPYYRTAVGEHENSASSYGTFDQGGNVFEWSETLFAGSYRIVRGGSFMVGGSG